MVNHSMNVTNYVYFFYFFSKNPADLTTIYLVLPGLKIH